MLKLLVFVPCEKVIIAQPGQVSLIGVLEMIIVNVRKELSPNALIPFKWSALTLWTREQPIEQPVEYQQEIRLVRPDGTEALKIESEFTVTSEHENFRQVAEVPVLPVGQEGRHLCKLFLRQVNQEWQEVAYFPFLVQHNKQIDAEQTSKS